MIVCYRSLPTHKDYNCPDCLSYYAGTSTCIDYQCIPSLWAVSVILKGHIMYISVLYDIIATVNLILSISITCNSLFLATNCL